MEKVITNVGVNPRDLAEKVATIINAKAVSNEKDANKTEVFVDDDWGRFQIRTPLHLFSRLKRLGYVVDWRYRSTYITKKEFFSLFKMVLERKEVSRG